MRVLLFLSLLAAGGLALAGRPALAFDDSEFCVAAKELLRATAVDVGTWTDRFTRQDGSEIGCDVKAVHFKRFYKAPGTIGPGWMDSQAAAWESAYCSRPLWREAIENGWVVSATVTTSAGPRVWLACLPNGKGFFKVLP